MADLVLTQFKGAASGSIYHLAIRTPLVTDGAHAIPVCQGIGGRQNLALGGDASDFHEACWRLTGQADRLVRKLNAFHLSQRVRTFLAQLVKDGGDAR